MGKAHLPPRESIRTHENVPGALTRTMQGAGTAGVRKSDEKDRAGSDEKGKEHSAHSPVWVLLYGLSCCWCWLASNMLTCCASERSSGRVQQARLALRWWWLASPMRRFCSGVASSESRESSDEDEDEEDDGVKDGCELCEREEGSRPPVELCTSMAEVRLCRTRRRRWWWFGGVLATPGSGSEPCLGGGGFAVVGGIANGNHLRVGGLHTGDVAPWVMDNSLDSVESRRFQTASFRLGCALWNRALCNRVLS